MSAASEQYLRTWKHSTRSATIMWGQKSRNILHFNVPEMNHLSAWKLFFMPYGCEWQLTASSEGRKQLQQVTTAMIGTNVRKHQYLCSAPFITLSVKSLNYIFMSDRKPRSCLFHTEPFVLEAKHMKYIDQTTGPKQSQHTCQQQEY